MPKVKVKSTAAKKSTKKATATAKKAKQTIPIDNLFPLQEVEASRIQFPEETNQKLNFFIRHSKLLNSGLEELVGPQTASKIAKTIIHIDKLLTHHNLKSRTEPEVREDLKQIARGGVLPAIAVAALPIIGETVLAGLTAKALSLALRKITGRGLVGLQGAVPPWQLDQYIE